MFLIGCPAGLVNVECPSAYLCKGFYGRKPEGDHMSSGLMLIFFFLAVVSLLLCIGIELICVVVFVSCVQELDSVPLRCSSVLFWVLFSYEVITMFSSLSCGI